MSGTLGKGHKQTPETLAAVVDGLKAGLTPKRAAMRAGISESTYFAWSRAGWDAIEATDENSSEEMSFVVRFALEAEGAISEYVLPLIRRVGEAALKGGPAIGERRRQFCRADLRTNFPKGSRSRKANGSKSRAVFQLTGRTSAARWIR